MVKVVKMKSKKVYDASSKGKQKRARSEEDKRIQLNRIINAGRELYIKKGWQGFGMRALARQLGMSEGNLYNYVKSKRELWIAIRAQYYQEFNNKLNNLINKHKGKISYIELLKKIGEFYLDFATEDHPRFLLMTIISAPDSKEKGPIEINYKPFNSMLLIQDVIKEAIDVREIKAVDPETLSYYLWGMAYGAIKVERELQYRDPILEPIITGSKILSGEEYRKFFLQELQKQLKNSTWK